MDANEAKTPGREKTAQEASTPLSTTKDMVIETPATPVTPVTPYSFSNTDYITDDMDENEEDISNTSINTERAFQVSAKITTVTPGPIKARRQLEENKFLNSPSDALLSPCTEMLMGRGGKKAVSGPAAALRKKQVGSIPFTLNED